MKRETIWKTSIATTAEAEDAVAELLATHVAPSRGGHLLDSRGGYLLDDRGGRAMPYMMATSRIE